MISIRTKSDGNLAGDVFLHLEQADTGLDTRNNGLSEKLDLGILAYWMTREEERCWQESLLIGDDTAFL